MHSMYAELARSHHAQRLEHARLSERRYRMVAALRAQRRADAAASRARRLLALSVMR